MKHNIYHWTSVAREIIDGVEQLILEEDNNIAIERTDDEWVKIIKKYDTTNFLQR